MALPTSKQRAKQTIQQILQKAENETFFPPYQEAVLILLKKIEQNTRK